MAEISSNEWEAFTAKYPNHHILQATAWGQLKAEFGWQVIRIAAQDCGAQMLVKQVLPGIRFAYIPKGPVGGSWEEILPAVDKICRSKKCIFLKVEPDDWTEAGQSRIPAGGQLPRGFVFSAHSIQPMRTLVVNIADEEIEILSRMKQKTRYNINLAMRKNVTVKPYTQMGTFYDLMEITGQRDQFGIHSLAYYQRAFDLFQEKDLCCLLVAEYDGTPLAAVIVFRNGKRAWYFYGASSNLHRERMPNYLLQWEAMRWAKSQGCTEYDLWGVPDADLIHLETAFSTRSEGLWGVYRFKRGFGGELRRSAGPWDRIYNPGLYKLYSVWQKYKRTDG